MCCASQNSRTKPRKPYGTINRTTEQAQGEKGSKPKQASRVIMPGSPTRRRRLLSSHVLLPVLLLLVLLGLVIAVREHAVHEEEHACPDHPHAHGSPEDGHHSHHHHDSPASPSSPPEGASGPWLHQHLPKGEWAKAFGATAIISIFPTLVLPFIPLTRSVNGVASLNEGVHKLLLSFAAGGLLGEVFLHSLPHLLEHHDHFTTSSSSSSSSHQHHQHDGNEEAHDDGHHEHSHAHGGGVRLEEGEVMRICLYILAGFLLFFVSEKAVTVVLGDEGGHSHSSHGHGHTHTHAHAVHGKANRSRAYVSEDEEGEEEEVDEEEEEGEEEESQGLQRRSPRIRERYSGPERRQIATSSAAAAAGGRNNTGGIHRRKPSSPSSPKKQQQQRQIRAVVEEEGGWSGLKASGYLNIVVDVLHNLTDGIAIGASFASGQGVGLATTLSVFLHEVPHEIGDFAILVQSGLSVRNAFFMQFFTAIAAFLGTFLGLVAKRQEGLERVLLALTTGGFLYVACVSVLPELLSGGGKGGGGQAVREVGGVLAGIGLMAWVAMGEHGHEH